MPTQFTIDVELSPQLKRNLRPPPIFAEPLREFLEDVGEFTNDEAERLAPEGVTRNLAESHTYTVDTSPLPLFVEVRPEARYAAAVHEGAGPHWVPIAALRPWAESRGINPYALQRSIARKGTKPHPWLPQAARAGRMYILRRMGHLATSVVQRWAK